MESQRIDRGVPMVRQRRETYRELHFTIASAVRLLAGEAGRSVGGRTMRLDRLEFLYKVRGLLQPNGEMPHIGAVFELSAHEGVTMRPVILSLPLEFGITLAELMRKHPTVGIYQCEHTGCLRIWAVKMGRGTGKGSKSRHCALHKPDSTKADQESKNGKSK